MNMFERQLQIANTLFGGFLGFWLADYLTDGDGTININAVLIAAILAYIVTAISYLFTKE